MPLGFITTTLAIALHSFLSHEVLHGHPFRVKALNEALVFPAIGLFIPYGRFRDTHLAHHRDENLTDPYDDPESNYLDPKVWAHLNTPVQKILRFNNTLLGRILIGPLVSQITFMWSDWAMIQRSDADIRNAWIWHFVGMVPVIWWMGRVMQLPVLAYVLAAYFGLSILKIRTLFGASRSYRCPRPHGGDRKSGVLLVHISEQQFPHRASFPP